MKNVLIVAYYFPPYAGVTARIEKNYKYLPKFGWNPLILTVDPRYYNEKVILEKNIQSSNIYRIPYIKIPFASLLVRGFLPLLVLIYSLFNYKKINAIYLTGGVFFPFIVTTIVTGIFKMPSILDFRDSWSINYGFDGRKKQGFKANIKEKILGVLEKISIHYATEVIFATSHLQDEYEQLFPTYTHKFHTINNGIDPDDFVNITPKKITQGKTIIVTGKFYLYTPSVIPYFMELLKNYSDITFIYVGSEHEIIKQFAKQFNVQKQVITYKYQLYEKTLELIAGADYCIVTTGMVNGLGTKIFDYLALSKPVLCFVPKNSILTTTLGSLDNIIICEPKYTLTTVDNGIKKLIHSNNMDNQEVLKDFSRVYSSEKLAQYLSKIS